MLGTVCMSNKRSKVYVVLYRYAETVQCVRLIGGVEVEL